MKSLKPIPKVAYERMKTYLKRHSTLHMFTHQIYCRLMLNYRFKPYEEFLEEKYEEI